MADPYQMNQDHSQRPVEKYETGNPSTWAEDPHDLDSAPGRNELGLPLPSKFERSRDEVGDFDHAGPKDNERAASRRARERFAALQNRLEKKALQCIKIARTLLPKAADAAIEEQALDLMSLSDESVISTIVRLAEEEASDEGEDMADEDAAEEAADADEAGKEAAEEGDDAEEADEDDAEDGDAEEADEEADEDDAEEADEDEGDKESSVMAQLRDLIDTETGKQASAAPQYDQRTVQAALGGTLPQEPGQVQSMLESLDMEQFDHQASQGMDISLAPPMDAAFAEDMGSDPLLAKVMEQQQIDLEQRTASNKRGIRSLGRVKEANQGGEGVNALAKLWKSRPDVSGNFQ